MNKQIEALKMAIEWKNSNKYTAEQVIETCKEALAEAEKQKWQSLSDDEIDNIWSMNFEFGFRACARAIEQALKELNAKK